MFEVKIVADSIANDIRLTTIQLKYPRFIHSELMTHRMFSRNASSSRAIPISKMVEQVLNAPAMPIHWGKNKAGMQADGELPEHIAVGASIQWRRAALNAAHMAESLGDIGVHKQVANRILEPFQWMSTIVTATEWDNFFSLRCHPAAQPEMQHLANLMKSAMDASSPQELEEGDWHLPYINEGEIVMAVAADGIPFCLNLDDLILCSAARCARVSYLNHDQSTPDIVKDMDLADKLISMKHMSPLEHQATPMQKSGDWEDGVTHMTRDGMKWSGNFRGWIQHRHLL